MNASTSSPALNTSVQADEEAKTHSIDVTVVNSSGDVSGMYAMENAIITKQDDGTYLVKMHQKNKNRKYMALTRDVTAATQHLCLRFLYS